MLDDLWVRVVSVSREFILLSVIYICLGYLVKRGRVFGETRKALPDIRLDVIYLLIDAALIAPVLVLMIDVSQRAVRAANLQLVDPAQYEKAPALAIVFFVIAIMDLTGYWRHRFTHMRWMWPLHAIHHSETEMSWLALARFHPLDRLITTVFNALILAMLGVPGWAVAISVTVIHHYGYFIHANIPWTYGPLSSIFVSPVMHRWHHTKEAAQSNKNFATVFAFFDYIFGTYYVPKGPVSALGVDQPDFPCTWVGQLVHPFSVWLGRLRAPVICREPRPRPHCSTRDSDMYPERADRIARSHIQKPR